MGDRVHPSDLIDGADKRIRTYVIQIPKDQIYKIPPPENAYHFRNYTTRRHGHHMNNMNMKKNLKKNWIIGIILSLFLILLGSALFYLFLRPQTPRYSLDTFSVSSSSSSSSSSFSPQFNLTFRSNNPNKNIAIYYLKGSSCAVYYARVELGNAVMPVFYQPSANVTVFGTALKTSGLALGTSVHQSLLNQQSEEKIPFDLKLKLPVKFKLASVKTWTFSVKVSCHVTVDKLTPESKILSKYCHLSVKPW